MSLDKVASSVIEDTLKEKLGNPSLSSDDALKIYQGLQSSGKIPTNTSKVFEQKLDNYSNANIAAVLESASEKDIKEAYGEDSELTELILKSKSKSLAAERFNYLVSMGDEMFDQVHKLDKNSNLAKNFVFKSDGAVFIKRSDELNIDDDMKPFVQERKASLEMYKGKLKDLVYELSVDKLNQAYNHGSQSTLPSSRPSTIDTYSSSNSNMPAMYHRNPHYKRLYSRALREINAVSNLDPRQRSLYLNGLSGNPLVNSGDLFANNPYQDISGTNLDYLWGG